MRTRRRALLALALLTACGATTETVVPRDTRVERLTVHPNGDTRSLRFEATTGEAIDREIIGEVDWRRRGESEWTLLVRSSVVEERVLRGRINLPPHVKSGDEVRFRARFLGRDGAEVSGFGTVAEVP